MAMTKRWSSINCRDDPVFSGTMIMRWSLEAVLNGIKITVIAEHEAAMQSTLANLAAFVA